MDDPEMAAALAAILFPQNTMLPILFLSMEDETSRRNRSRRKRYATLTEEQKIKRVRKIPRAATLSPARSPWEYVYRSDNIAGFITSTGVDPTNFRILLRSFAPIFRTTSPYSDNGFIRTLPHVEAGLQHRGRKRLITDHACLALVLYWTRTKCYYWTIAQFFGLTVSCVEKWLRYGKRVLLRVLGKRDDSVISMPNADKVKSYVQAISSKYPRLKSVGLVGDGLKILLEKASDRLTQNPFYNGWKADHYITNLFVFAPDGTIVAAVLNCPGAMHDSELAGFGCPSIYNKIDTLYETHGVQTVMDSAFCTTGRESIIKSLTRETIYTQCRDSEHALILEDAKSVRQAAEWGMRALQGSMPRLKARWSYEERDERLIGMTLISLLHNFKANNMDLNQIRSVYWSDVDSDTDTVVNGETVPISYHVQGG